MRLNNFLNEGSLYKELSDVNVIKTLKENCKRALNHYIQHSRDFRFKFIWRGDMQIDKDFYLFKGNKSFVRKSANTSNHYTIMFSELLPSWKNIPKRNKSLICSTSVSDAYGYRRWT